MKGYKKALAIGTMLLTIGATSVGALAASAYNTPAEAVAGLTGRAVDSVIAEKVDTGNTYGTIAIEAGIQDQFKTEVLEMKKDRLQTRVEAGSMTQEQADGVLKAIEENQATCDGSGGARIGQTMGAGFGAGQCNGSGQRLGASHKMGQGNGSGQGQGLHAGGGHGQGAGGMGLRDGSCQN